MIPRRLTKEELAQIEDAGSKKLSILASWAYNQFSCSHCGKCKRRCEVLSGPDLDIGQINAAYDSIMALPEDERIQATIDLVYSDYAMYNALRQCCFCGHCTAACMRHVLAAQDMRLWRELFMKANIMPPDDSKLVMVDNEWNIFSAYRAIYQVHYPDYPTLEWASTEGKGTLDTLFFPGCSLGSYAPELMGAICDWLQESGVKFAVSLDCCGSPLMSAGLFDRAKSYREKLISMMHEAGISRMVTVCPGCTDEFHESLPEGIEIVPLPELMEECLDLRKEAGMEDGLDPMSFESITFFDSCHDRNDMRNANALRRLLGYACPDAEQRELVHSKRGSLCCGAGGAVSSYDADLSNSRVWRVLDEAKATNAQTLISMCPTCAYTFAQANLSNPEQAMSTVHYLEALLGVRIDWEHVFAQLNGMWTGEYGPWLEQTFF